MDQNFSLSTNTSRSGIASLSCNEWRYPNETDLGFAHTPFRPQYDIPIRTISFVGQSETINTWPLLLIRSDPFTVMLNVEVSPGFRSPCDNCAVEHEQLTRISFILTISFPVLVKFNSRTADSPTCTKPKSTDFWFIRSGVLKLDRS
jgi:hypothetical protein